MKQAPSIFKPMFKMNFRTSQCHFFEILYTFFLFFLFRETTLSMVFEMIRLFAM